MSNRRSSSSYISSVSTTLMSQIKPGMLVKTRKHALMKKVIGAAHERRLSQVDPKTKTVSWIEASVERVVHVPVGEGALLCVVAVEDSGRRSQHRISENEEVHFAVYDIKMLLLSGKGEISGENLIPDGRFYRRKLFERIYDKTRISKEKFDESIFNGEDFKRIFSADQSFDDLFEIIVGTAS